MHILKTLRLTISFSAFLGWWFDACGPSNLNGIFFQQGQNSNRFNGIKWYYWKGSGYSLKSTTKMIRPVDFWGCDRDMPLTDMNRMESRALSLLETTTQTRQTNKKTKQTEVLYNSTLITSEHSTREGTISFAPTSLILFLKTFVQNGQVKTSRKVYELSILRNIWALDCITNQDKAVKR